MSDQQKKTVIVKETLEFTLEDVSDYCQLPVEVVIELIGLGLFDTPTVTELRFNTEHLSRIQSAARLFHDLKINAPGVVLAVELLDEIEALRQELAILERLRR
jgi:chaperone modulatory protein CbpM